MKKTEIHFIDDPILDFISIYMINSDLLGKRANATVGERGSLTFKILKGQGELLDPLIKMPKNIFKDFLESAIDYANKNDIVLDKETALAAKLEVTQAHLATVQTYFEKAFNYILKQKK